MPTRLTSVVIDSHDLQAQARFWSAALGWRITYEHLEGDEPEVDVEPPPGEAGPELTFVRVPEPKTVKNRVHLDLRSGSLQEQAALVERLLGMGATRVDIGQGDDAKFVVLADPEGNEFCVLDPREEYGDTGALAAVVLDADDPPALARFWVEMAGGRIAAANEHSTGIRLSDGAGPWLDLVRVPEPHTVKNRLHLDVRPFAGDDQNAEVERALGLGARRAEVGQSSAPPENITWTVLSDPENNEFCILRPR
jgi:catechol 2,3-dioxygenase-like lactoylglutathione lyase family enzyme